MAENEKLQNLWRRYEKEHDHLAVSARQVVKWAVEKGLLELPEIDPFENRCWCL